MSGQTLYCDEKQNIVNEFAKKINIYEPHTPFKFNLRGYKEYLVQNGIENEHITEDIVNKFMK